MCKEKVRLVTALFIAVLSLLATASMVKSETPLLIALRRDVSHDTETLRLEFINGTAAPAQLAPNFDVGKITSSSLPSMLLETVPGNSDLVVCVSNITNTSSTEDRNSFVARLKCLRKNGTSFPVTLPLEDSKIPFLYFQVDGINAYWKQRGEKRIWATSLSTGYTGYIAVTSTSTNPYNENFRIDTSIGVVFHIDGEVFHINQNRSHLPFKRMRLSPRLHEGHAEMQFSHMAINTKLRQLFFYRSQKIIRANYSSTGDVTFESDYEVVPVEEKLEYFDYMHDNLLLKTKNELISLMTTGTGDPVRISTNHTLLAIAVVKSEEDETPKVSDLCPVMELPLFGYGYICVCQAGYLSNGNSCAPPDILMHYSTGDDEVLSNSTVFSCTDSAEEDPFSPYCKALSNVSYDGSLVQFDPFQMGYLEQITGERRILYWNFNSSEPTTLLSVPASFELVDSALDFSLGILFWIQSGVYGDRRGMRVHSRMINTGETPAPFVPFNGHLSSLTIDAQNLNLFWVHENPGGKTLIKTDYNTEGIVQMEEHLISLSQTSEVILQAFTSHVIYYYIKDTTPKLVVLDVVKKSTTSISLQKPLRSFYLLPDLSSESHSRCYTECNEVCLPIRNRHQNGDTCRCCDDKIITKVGYCDFLTFVTYERTGHQLSVHELEGREGGKKTFVTDFPGDGSPRHILSSLNTDTVCIQRSDGGNETLCRRRKLTGIFQVPQVDPNAALIQLSDDGDEIYWTNYRGDCVRMRNLDRDSVIKFRCVAEDSVVLYLPVIDTIHKILFWYSGQGQLHMGLLYQNQGHADYVLLLPYPLIGWAPDVSGSKLYFWTKTKYLQMISYAEFVFGDNTGKNLTARDSILQSNHFSHFNGSFFMRYYANRIFYNRGNRLSMDNLISLKSLDLENLLMLGQNGSGGEILRVFVQGRPPAPTNATAAACKACSDFCYEGYVKPVTVSCGCSEGSRLLDDGKSCAASGALPLHWIIGTSVVALLICGSMVGIVIFVMRRSRNKYMRKALEQIQTGDPRRVRTAANESDRALYLPLPLAYLIQPSEVQVDNDSVLGEGQYGMVVQGLYRNMPVAIKTFKSIDLNTVVEFTKEIKIMAFIDRHPCIVLFHGAVVGRGFFYAVMELSKYGNLSTYLTEKMRDLISRAPEVEKIRLVNLMLSWCEDIAKGMNHLVEKQVIHGDLATRNVLLFDGFKAKITDFGLSRNVNPNYMAYQKANLAPLPWKWMDYDALRRLSFSAESDVWAFGVTMWEIFTLGEVPYPQYMWDDEFTNALKQGLRLTIPDLIPSCIFEGVVTPCWELSRANRIKFPEIIQKLEEYQAHAQCMNMVENTVRIVPTPRFQRNDFM